MTEMRTKADFRALRETVGLNQAYLAQILGIHEMTVKDWEKPQRPGWQPDSRYTLTLEDGYDTVEGTLSYWPNRPNGNTYEWAARKNSNMIRGGADSQRLAWQILIKDMRELHDRH